ncbi:hypothetical protein ACH5RR_030087 [Cinchona calisaya]|uniref:Uncharacterized protein n=1 Tax=Cinchona calisaya TaxID=153742 RepID=A0ABD2YVT8_9GENT
MAAYAALVSLKQMLPEYVLPFPSLILEIKKMQAKALGENVMRLFDCQLYRVTDEVFTELQTREIPLETAVENILNVMKDINRFLSQTLEEVSPIRHPSFKYHAASQLKRSCSWESSLSQEDILSLEGFREPREEDEEDVGFRDLLFRSDSHHDRSWMLASPT